MTNDNTKPSAITDIQSSNRPADMLDEINSNDEYQENNAKMNNRRLDKINNFLDRWFKLIVVIFMFVSVLFFLNLYDEIEDINSQTMYTNRYLSNIESDISDIDTDTSEINQQMSSVQENASDISDEISDLNGKVGY